MDFVKLDGVTKRFNEVVAVNDISLGVEKGEFLTLLGPSGCGKTTTLRIIAGFAKPDTGSVYIKGRNMNDIPPHKRNTGMVFQNYALFPHMNAYENVVFGLKMRKLGKEETKKRVKTAFDLVRLSGLEERYPRQMSGGQQQRIALARALVIEPDVLLFDEPLSNLDLKLRQQMRLEIKKIQRRVGITSIYVTHDQGEALIMSDRLAIMNKGIIMQLGTAKRIYEHPENLFVASFIGQINLFEGKISEINEGEAAILTNDDLTIYALCAEYGDREFKPNTKVTLCVRPERISIEKTKKSGKNVFKANIGSVIYIGDSINYVIRLDNGHKVNVNKQITEKSVLHKEGETVYVKWSPENSLLMPAPIR